MKLFKDGLQSLTNSLANVRNASVTNRVTSQAIDNDELNSIYKTGLGNKIVSLKANSILKAGISCENEELQKVLQNKLLMPLSDAITYMLAFGRGIVVIDNGTIASEPLKSININKIKFKAFSGYDTTVTVNTTRDILADRFYKPEYYYVQGAMIHHTRVIDLTYIKPVLTDLPNYNYGGISEFERIYSQLINDEIVERSSGAILEKNSTLFYKIKGFKDLLKNGKEENIVSYFSKLEHLRGIYGAGLLDAEDETKVETQSLANLDGVDTISLRRVAMVSSIPLSWLVGENVKGLNSTGDNENAIFWNEIENITKKYVLPVLNEKMQYLKLDNIQIVNPVQISPKDRAEQDNILINNALMIESMGFNKESYLSERGLNLEVKNSFASEFPEEIENED